jgi:competence protein ComEA
MLQHKTVLRHHNPMRSQRFFGIAGLAVLLSVFVACASKDNPDEIRQRTAEATETVKRDATAMAEGVKEGLGRAKTINVNKASREDLLTLPGLTERQADQLVAHRPFQNAHDLVTRRIVSETEYDKIRDRVIAGH